MRFCRCFCWSGRAGFRSWRSQVEGSWFRFDEKIFAQIPAQEAIVTQGGGGRLVWPGLLRKLDRMGRELSEIKQFTAFQQITRQISDLQIDIAAIRSNLSLRQRWPESDRQQCVRQWLRGRVFGVVFNLLERFRE